MIELDLICIAETPGATRSGYSWMPTIAAARF